MKKPSSPLSNSLSIVTSSIKHSLHWWIRGLCFPLSSKLQTSLFPQKTLVPIIVDDDVLHLPAPTLVKLNELTDRVNTDTIPISDLPELLKLFAKERHLEPVLCLPANRVLKKQFSVPLVKPTELKAMVEFELDRITPFEKGEYLYDYWQESADESSSQSADKVSIKALIIPKNILAPVLALYKQFTLSLRITALDDHGQPLRLNFLKQSTGNSANPSYRWPLSPSYLFAGIAAIAFALYAPLTHYRSVIDSLNTALDDNRRAAITLREETLNQTLLNNQAYFLSNLETHYYSPLNVLREINTTLPENTWLQTFSLQGATIQLKGESPSAATTLALIESHSLLTNAEFYAPVSNAQDNKEQFHILSHVEGNDVH